MDSNDLQKLVNRSGFLFQLAVEEYVRQTSSAHGWEVMAREYPWSSPDGTRRGFIDLVAGRNTLRCVLECKRTQGGEWVFPIQATASQTTQLRTLWAFLAKDRAKGWGWDDIQFEPATLVSEFCIVRGASDDDKPMLERVAGDVVRAAESLAREELALHGQWSGSAGYLPVIVTNARLYACRVDLSSVDLQSGTLPPEATFEEVNAIRFRKALSSDVAHDPETYTSLKEGLLRKERSAFVVQVTGLADWLAGIRELRRSGTYPWSHLES